MPKQWFLTQEHFDTLLAWLSSDREQAAMKYENIRQTLIKLFTWNGWSDAEGLADETIDRVTQKLPGLKETYIGDPALYFYGVAKKVILERRRRNYARDEFQLAEPARLENDLDGVDSDPKFECLDRCIQKLSRRNRQLVLEYYQEEKRAKIEFRREMAEKMGVEVNNLRVRMHRIRASLHKCIRKCLDELIAMQ
jgi:DNA-directed RNA polymerase specialized sigma24 family protein